MSVLKVSIQVDPDNSLNTRLKIDTGPDQTSFPFESLSLMAKPPISEAYNLELKLRDENRKTVRSPKTIRGFWRKLAFWLK